MRLTRFYAPVLLTSLIVAVYLFVLRTPLIWNRVDQREMIFGADLGYLQLAIAAAANWILIRLIDAIVFDLVFTKRTRSQAPHLLRDIVAIALYLFFFASAITVLFQKSMTGLLGATTVVAAVLGLALQDTLGNLFAGISMHMERGIHVGDVLHSGEFIGVIERITWRAVRLRTFDNNIVMIPNSLIARERLEIFPNESPNGRTVMISVTYTAPPAKVIEVLERAARNVNGISRKIACLVRIGSFDSSAVNYEIRYWTETYALRDTIDAEIRKAAWYALRRHGISQPYPIRSLQMLPAESAAVTSSNVSVLERLLEIDMLLPLSDGEHRRIADGTRTHRYGRGETIIHAGEAGSSMFIVDEGTVSIRVNEGAGSREIAQLGPGSLFGEMALLTGESRVADVVASTEVVTLEITKDTLQPILIENPSLASALTEKVLERRGNLADQAAAQSEDRSTLLSRIRSYFAI